MVPDYVTYSSPKVVYYVANTATIRDTWKRTGGKEITVEEVMHDLQSYLPFFQASGGGITVSGGEPLLQIEFLTELFKECKKLGIHTTIDSSGGPFNRRPGIY